MRTLVALALAAVATVTVGCTADQAAEDDAASSSDAIIDDTPEQSACRAAAMDEFLSDSSRRNDLDDDEAEPIDEFAYRQIRYRCDRDGAVDVKQLLLLERVVGYAVSARASDHESETRLSYALTRALSTWDDFNRPRGVTKALLDDSCTSDAATRLASRKATLLADLDAAEAKIVLDYAYRTFDMRCETRSDAGYSRVHFTLWQLNNIIGRRTDLRGVDLVRSIVTSFRADGS